MMKPDLIEICLQLEKAQKQFQLVAGALPYQQHPSQRAINGYTDKVNENFQYLLEVLKRSY